ncbi:hypothetical protein CLV24_104225 [Pontibacter ummariensis]|uniref:Endonuclease/Exonuclease/phosphatase family protein n=1 Tax=Pontibacter ummariensis TaxID=1610492 RepID=A0A239DHR1_9BACT|nr:endonuclease/exonuclease/phosphatase family protein [Pontibacter ummariensis]PRY14413.1 hypothetical protein CLV24_104225 [Pontibacter ummariensis]SNS31408.1 Endonuclease/Exonuclease/phosphatase family protein [Pontibacter ummariensis]
MRHGIKTLCLLFTLIVLVGCSRLPLTSKKSKLYTIGFYNTENLFDTEDDAQTVDEAFTPGGERNWTEERYQAKLKGVAKVIAGLGGKGGPALVGLSEVENKQVLQDLINTAPLDKYDYSIIHQDSPDPQGLDVALLYKPKVFTPTATESIPIDFEEQGFSSRDILKVQGELRGEPLTVYVNHWPSEGRNRSGRPEDSRLRAAATTLRQQIEAQRATDENSKIIVLGDFNAEPKSAVLEQVLQATGRPNPYYTQELFNTTYLPFVNGLGTYANRGNLQMLDQVLISKSLLDDKPGLQYVRGSANVYAPEEAKYLFGKYKDTPIRTYADNLYIGGYSDHFPVYIQLQEKKQRKAL